jgi:hypothetical protein
VEVEHRPRTHGVSKYGASRFIKGVLDLLAVYFLCSYQQRPLHFFGVLGVLLSGLGILGGTYLTVLWFSGQPIGTRPLLLLSVLLIIVGIQVVLFGLMSQLQIDIFHKTGRDHPSMKIVRRDFSVDAAYSETCVSRGGANRNVSTAEDGRWALDA